MKEFLGKDFLLENDFGSVLYHNYAASMPIIDYHNHLPPQDIATDRKFKSITEAWLEGDHYKWRAMRAFGIDEKYITGDTSDKEKFEKWSEVVPFTIRNPLYHWTHLELQRYFDIKEILNPKSSSEIYDKSSSILASDGFGCRGLLERMNAKVLCTTDDPTDDLKYHQQLDKEGYSIKVLPTFRPDKLYTLESEGYLDYLATLKSVVSFEIKSLDDLLNAISSRVDYFHANGCRLSDHGLEQLYAVPVSLEKSQLIFQNRLEGKLPSKEELIIFKMTILVELAKLYHKNGWTQQFHLGAIRNNNRKKLKVLGPDTGYDSIGDYRQVEGLSLFLRNLEDTDQLAKTILYNLNPNDNEAFATMAGNFMDSVTPSKIQFGSAWWFLDQNDGMERQMNALSNMGLLSKFIGMLTDSRSFLSFPRHEYFRRILCNLIGRDVEKGLLPADETHLGGIVQDICYNNAKNYLKLN